MSSRYGPTRGVKGPCLEDGLWDWFEPFNQEDFLALPQQQRIELRDYLRNNGVYVSHGRGIQIGKALYQAVQEGPLPWPEDDPLRPDIPRKAEVKPPSASWDPRPYDPRDGKGPRGVPVTENPTTSFPPTSFNPQDQRAPSTDLSRNIGNLAKLYSEEEKYSGATDDDFDSKSSIFAIRCRQMGIMEDQHMAIAFPVMLAKAAAKYYYQNLSRVMTFKELAIQIKTRFHSEERTRALIRDWEQLSLPHIIANAPGKNISQCLNALIDKATDLQVSLPRDYHSDNMMKNKLLNAVKDVESCKLAYQKPAATVSGVIADLYASVATEKTTPAAPAPAAFYTDRKYHRRFPRGDDRRPQRPRRCFVCGKEDCWSDKHPFHERKAAFRNKPAFRKFFTENDESGDRPEPATDDDDAEEMNDELDELSVLMANIDIDDAPAT